MDRFFPFLTSLLRGLATITGWTLILVGALALGIGTLPRLYLVATGSAQPGFWIFSSQVLAQGEYWIAVAVELAAIAGGFLLRKLARVVR